MNLLQRAACALSLVAMLASTNASSFRVLSLDEQLQGSVGAFRGTVLKTESFIEDGVIQTRAFIRVDESFKGKLPRVVKVVNEGGVVGDVGMLDGYNPQLKVGDEKVLFVSRQHNGRLTASHGVLSCLRSEETVLKQLRSKRAGNGKTVDLTDQASDIDVAMGDSTINGGAPSSTAPGLSTHSDGLGSRFVATDQGLPIQYLIDADALPAGVTLPQATNAVYQALNAWSAVANVKFQFIGFQSFGVAATTISTNDGKLRVQLHDLYNSITSGSVLGRGGRVFNTTKVSGSGWTTGGNVASNDFHASTCGFLVLKHTATEMQNPVNMAEVLCHEFGHVLGLAHSSETFPETNSLLANATMYFQIHGGGRGATLGAYDPPIVRGAYPTNNTPPFTIPRIINAVTYRDIGFVVPGVNEVEMRGYDLQSTNLTLVLTNVSGGGGSFTQLSGNRVRFVPDGFYSGAHKDPAGNSYYTLIYARVTDGTNASPYVMIRVLGFDADYFEEGIPSNWMTQYFGDFDPDAGPNRHATDDYDGDGLTNLQEFLLGTNPTDKASNLHFSSISSSQLQWEATAYEPYELQTTTNFTTWTRVYPINIPTTGLGSTSIDSTNLAKQFFRVIKVP
jgi:hypothetical protein